MPAGHPARWIRDSTGRGDLPDRRLRLLEVDRPGGRAAGGWPLGHHFRGSPSADRLEAGGVLTNPYRRANRHWRWPAYQVCRARSLVRLARVASIGSPHRHRRAPSPPLGSIPRPPIDVDRPLSRLGVFPGRLFGIGASAVTRRIRARAGLPGARASAVRDLGPEHPLSSEAGAGHSGAARRRVIVGPSDGRLAAAAREGAAPASRTHPARWIVSLTASVPEDSRHGRGPTTDRLPRLPRGDHPARLRQDRRRGRRRGGPVPPARRPAPGRRRRGEGAVADQRRRDRRQAVLRLAVPRAAQGDLLPVRPPAAHADQRQLGDHRPDDRGRLRAGAAGAGPRDLPRRHQPRRLRAVPEADGRATTAGSGSTTWRSSASRARASSSGR